MMDMIRCEELSEVHIYYAIQNNIVKSTLVICFLYFFFQFGRVMLLFSKVHIVCICSWWYILTC